MARDSEKKQRAAQQESFRIYMIAFGIVNAIFIGCWWFFEVDFGFWSYIGFVIMAVGYALSVRGIVAAAGSMSVGSKAASSSSAFDADVASSAEGNERLLKFSWNDLFYVTAICQVCLSPPSCPHAKCVDGESSSFI